MLRIRKSLVLLYNVQRYVNVSFGILEPNHFSYFLEAGEKSFSLGQGRHTLLTSWVLALD
jgi:hypothetical protein